MSQLTQPWVTPSCWDAWRVSKPRGQRRRKLRLSLQRANSFLQRTWQLFPGLAAAQHDSHTAKEGLPVPGTGVSSHFSAVELWLGKCEAQSLKSRRCWASGPTEGGKINLQTGGADSQEPPSPQEQQVSLCVPAGRQSQSCKAAAETLVASSFLVIIHLSNKMLLSVWLLHC